MKHLPFLILILIIGISCTTTITKKDNLTRNLSGNKVVRSIAQQNPMNLYDSIEEISEGLVRVEKDGKFGMIDRTGKEVIPLG